MMSLLVWCFPPEIVYQREYKADIWVGYARFIIIPNGDLAKATNRED